MDAESQMMDDQDRRPDEMEAVELGIRSNSDAAAKKDALGFAPYVKALSDFLMHPDTRGPLTVSIEGEWGSGKTSFMLQLQDELKRAGKRRWWSKTWRDQGKVKGPTAKHRKGVHTFFFNPWRFEKEDSLLASFAVGFSEGLASLPFYRRWWGSLKLFFRRFSWRSGWIDFVRWLVQAALFGLALWLIASLIAQGRFPLSESLGWLQSWLNDPDGTQLRFLEAFLRDSPGLAGVIVLLTLIPRVFEQLRSGPLSPGLGKHLDSPNYQERIAFTERFHKDFEHVLKAYAAGRRVFVFIDDLDRCLGDKSAELVQAISLLVSSDLNLFFIVGMDREKVAAGLAVKHEKLLKYLPLAGAISEGSGKGDDGRAARLTGLRFGFQYIEKFIQIPFNLPKPGSKEIGEYLKRLSGESEKPATGSTVHMEKSDLETASAVARIGADSEGLRDTCAALAPYLDHNPRRIKQLINLLRVRALVSARTGLLDENEFGRFTIQQLGKLVVISLHWPLFLMDVTEQPDLVSRLSKALKKYVALGEPELTEWGKLGEQTSASGMMSGPTIFQPIWDGMNSEERRWAMEKGLMRLILHGVFAEGGYLPVDSEFWDLEHLNLNPFLEVMPAVRVFSDELDPSVFLDSDDIDVDQFYKTANNREDRAEGAEGAAEEAPPEDYESAKS